MANVLTSIGNSLRNFIIGGFRYTGYKVWTVGTEEVYAPIESDTAISKGFNANTAVYSIVKKYAKKASSIERYLENKQSEEPFKDAHPLVALLNRPNENESQTAFFKKVFAFYKVCGESFIWLNRGDVLQEVNNVGELVERSPEQYKKQPVLEMHVIPANHMVVIPDKNDPFIVLGYQLRNNPSVKFRTEDIVHWKDLNLDWDEFSRPQMRGMTPLRPGYKTLTADNSFIDSMVRMAQNDGAKGAIVNKTVGKLSPKQETQVREVIDGKINNKEIKNAIAALEGDWAYLDFGLTSVDMQTLEAREFIYKELCFLLDVPYGFFDSHTPYAEKQLAARDWITNSIKPDCEELDEELERKLFPAFGLTFATAEICSNFDDLPELQEDKAKLMEWLNKAPLTGNQRLEALKYEPSDDPAMEEITSSETMTPIAGDPELEKALADIEALRTAQNPQNANGAANRTNGNGKVPSYS